MTRAGRLTVTALAAGMFALAAPDPALAADAYIVLNGNRIGNPSGCYQSGPPLDE